MPTLERHHKGCKGAIAYDVHGDGEPIVILRGLGRSVRHWLGYETTLARHFKVVTLDLRGIGATTLPCTWSTTLFDLASDVVAVLDALKLERAHVLGVSLGGMVTLATGIEHPERCRSLVTVNTSIAGLLTPRITPRALRAMLAGASRRPEAIHEALVEVLVGRDLEAQKRAEIARQYHDIAREEGLYGLTVMKQLIGAARFTVKRRLGELRVPTMIVYGTDDLFVPPLNSKRIAALVPDAKLVAIDGGGHELTLDKGDELAALVKDWVSEHSLRRQGSSTAG